MTAAEHPAKKVKSAGRALEIVDFVAERGSVTFQDVVDSGLPKSSAHGLLATLVESGWLERSAQTRRYRLGLRAWQVGHAYQGHQVLLEASQEVMDDVVARVGETVQLARLEGIENVYIGIRLSPKPMRMASSVGMRLHAHATGIGKALLSTLDPGEARRRLEAVALPRLTRNTVTDVDELMRVIGRSRELGYAVDDEEFIEDCRCVAVPVATEAETGVCAAMSVTMPTSRTDGRWPHSMYSVLREGANRIRSAMGLSGSLSP
ncbi:IclR family transcriptional regulator [Streptomonospora arabica]|uniref:IclR family transcriptional regulator n=1 Tax=Streptomonospora arabica TaxID=412417 RepID=A0ABV9SKG4_9ACTN